MDHHTLLHLLHNAEQLKYAARPAWTSGGRQESEAEHCWRMAVTAYLLRESFPEADMDRVVALCLFRGMEEYCPGLGKAAPEGQREQLLHRWTDDLPRPDREELKGLLRELTDRKTLESRICWALDALEELLQRSEAELSAWDSRAYTRALRRAEEQTAFSPVLRELREAVEAEALDKLRNNIPIDD